MNSASGKRFLAIGASGVLAVLLLVAAVWMMNRSGGVPDGAVQIAPPPEPAESAAADGTADAGLAGASDAPAATPETPDILAVYITGAVASPGVYRAPAGQRLDDLLALAGGPAADADLERVNLAAYLSDAAHYRIPAVDDAVQYGSAPVPALPASSPGTASMGGSAAETAGASGPCAAPVDINTADAACLETLPTIGPARAVAIVTHRRDAGPFAAAADITAVSGIGAGTYQRIAGLITVGGY